MNKMVNFGIDLGTTNSLIARFDKGQVEVFKNPNGFKESLPSVVGFRNDRILVGDQARTFAEKDPKGVASRFKRKMGTTETIKLNSGSKTPVELSAFVLKELKNFVHSGEAVEAAVITIPASFDTVQSNATKEAGLAAGFKQVMLLQEPIAASLAYANKEKEVDLRNSQWMVYDLGGGTFDVALVKIVEGELTVVDHEGDNYLGGSDFDAMLVEKVVVPEICRRGRFNDLLAHMKSEKGKYNKLWYRLLHAAEAAKIELSTKTSAEIDLGMVSLEDEDGNVVDSLLTVTRSEFEEVIKDAVDGTADMMKKILTRNSLRPEDLKFVLMVGGGAYIPYVRKRIEELMGLSVNTSIDPTNAIAVGAAFFAGTKEFNLGGEKAVVPSSNDRNLKIRTVFNRNSQEPEETFTAKVEGDVSGLFYRIYSEDGSFDSGLKALSGRISEDLPLREGAFNLFQFRILDGQNNPVDVGFDSIQIAQGRYSVAGQMLPEDICLVTDDIANKDTRLKRIFAKNGVLPAKTKGSVEVAKTVVKDSDDEIRIMVVEGPSEKHSSTNKPIGILLITGKQINRDVIRGTEIDLTFEVSESRDLTISAYLNGTGQEFSQVFKGMARQVDLRSLATEVLQLEGKIQAEADEASGNGNEEAAKGLERLLGQVQGLIAECGALSADDVTDDRFKLEDKKRRIAQEVFELTASKRLDAAKAAYVEAKREVSSLVSENGNDREKHQLREVFAREQTFINTTNPERIEAATSELENIRWHILMRMPDFLAGMFEHLVERRTSMNDQIQAKQLIEVGRQHISAQAWDDLKQVNGRLWSLMPDDARESDDMRLYTGIV